MDVWKYKDVMKKYVTDKYGFYEIKPAKRISDNVLILLRYYENSNKIYSHSYTYDEILGIIREYRKMKLERICKTKY